MDSDKLNEKRAQEILDRLDKDEFVFTMNELENEEYVTLPNGTKILTDILNGKINDQQKQHKIKENGKPINDQILQFDDYISTFDNDNGTKDDNNLLFEIDDTEGEDAFEETEKYYGSDEEVTIKITNNDKDEKISYTSTTSKPITIQSSHRQPISVGSLSVSDDGHLMANSPNIPVTPPPSLAKSQNMFNIFKNKEDILNSDKTSQPIPDGEFKEEDIQELLAKLVIHKDQQN
ncbi:hypothetical protein BCR36DRAFT_407660 [Piromyces finnis]|uniref:Uncharacterized protein n=1 Tax=Piromyces finnis TaxID=1754191 RepID=A0A1Y1UKV5_9FUNG|nr:hypothetical protein BCR36DRAFT_407660 [Piromyces finnis]|eukprot:ORX38106.1 hypothetical protein BCR36DRAFT_407660 [Piromyces finnis]